jgi:hypothetical protein
VTGSLNYTHQSHGDADMNCPKCQRPVKLFNLRRHSLIKKVVPRCGACHIYVLSWVHKIILLAVLVPAGLLLLLWYMKLL